MRDASGTLGAKEIIKKVLPRSEKYRKNPPKRIVTDDVLATLIHEDLAFTASTDPKEAIRQIREAGDKVVILPLEYRRGKELSDQIVKDISQKHYHNLDSPPIIRRAVELSRSFADMEGKTWSLPDGMSIDNIVRMTDKLAQSTGMYPYFLQKAAVELADSPKIGFYWTREQRVRATTWMRCVNSHETYQQYKNGEFFIEVGKIYADNIKVIVGSKSNPKDRYKVHIYRMPIFCPNDRRQHSEWRRLSCQGEVPDEVWRGKMHRKREPESIFFCSYVGAAYDAVAEKKLKEKDGKEVMINPFPMLTTNGGELVRILRKQTIIARRGLNMTEMDYWFGVDTKENKYDPNWVNWRRPVAKK